LGAGAIAEEDLVMAMGNSRNCQLVVHFTCDCPCQSIRVGQLRVAIADQPSQFDVAFRQRSSAMFASQ
jgi:hypothetical protein